jgi:hypothetical protein
MNKCEKERNPTVELNKCTIFESTRKRSIRICKYLIIITSKVSSMNCHKNPHRIG